MKPTCQFLNGKEKFLSWGFSRGKWYKNVLSNQLSTKKDHQRPEIQTVYKKIAFVFANEEKLTQN
jgi:hypothetical protein